MDNDTCLQNETVNPDCCTGNIGPSRAHHLPSGEVEVGQSDRNGAACGGLMICPLLQPDLNLPLDGFNKCFFGTCYLAAAYELCLWILGSKEPQDSAMPTFQGE